VSVKAKKKSAPAPPAPPRGIQTPETAPPRTAFDWSRATPSLCIPATPQQLENCSTVEIQRFRSITGELNRAIWLEWSRRKNRKVEGMGRLADMDANVRDHTLQYVHRAMRGESDKDFTPNF
jgi:hypothetical protein